MQGNYQVRRFSLGSSSYCLESETWNGNVAQFPLRYMTHEPIDWITFAAFLIQLG